MHSCSPPSSAEQTMSRKSGPTTLLRTLEKMSLSQNVDLDTFPDRRRDRLSACAMGTTTPPEATDEEGFLTCAAGNCDASATRIALSSLGELKSFANSAGHSRASEKTGENRSPENDGRVERSTSRDNAASWTAQAQGGT